MAINKKGFILYADLIHTVSKMTEEQAGKLFLHVLRYVNDENPEAEDIITQIAFEPIKQQLKRDLEKFNDKKFDRSKSGQLGNLKRWHKDIYDQVVTQEITLKEGLIIAKRRKVSHSDVCESQSIANVAVNDSVSVTVNDNVTVKGSKEGSAPILSIVTFESLVSQYFVSEKKKRINGDDRSAIIEIGKDLDLKMPNSPPESKRDKLIELIEHPNLKADKFWVSKRHNVPYLSKSFEEAWNMAFTEEQVANTVKEIDYSKYENTGA